MDILLTMGTLPDDEVEEGSSRDHSLKTKQEIPSRTWKISLLKTENESETFTNANFYIYIMVITLKKSIFTFSLSKQSEGISVKLQSAFNVRVGKRTKMAAFQLPQR